MRDTSAMEVSLEVAFERRMANWRNTVRDRHRGGVGQCCARWALAYVRERNQREQALAASLQMMPADALPPQVAVNELDGWLVEAAVRSLAHFDQAQALRYKYVLEYPNHFIRSKLHIRDSALRIVLARAIENLKLMLEKLETPARIKTYKLHAGTVPRLEA